jgi:hypothetical protein
MLLSAVPGDFPPVFNTKGYAKTASKPACEIRLAESAEKAGFLSLFLLPEQRISPKRAVIPSKFFHLVWRKTQGFKPGSHLICIGL